MAQQHVGLGVESVWGTAVASTDFLEGAKEADIAVIKEFEEITTIRSHSTRVVNLLNEHAAGTVRCIGNYQELGLLFKHFWGAVATTGAGPYTHTFPGSGGIPDAGRLGKSLTIEVKEAPSVLNPMRFSGCKVTQIRLSGDSGKSPELEFNFFGKSGVGGSESTFVDPGFAPILISDCDLDFDGTAMDVTAFDLTLQREVDEPYVIGTAAVAKEPVDSKLAVSGNLTVLLTDNVQFSKYLNNTNVAIHLIMTNGVQSLTLNMLKTRLKSFTKPVTAENSRIRATIEFMSFFDAVATENIQAILINSDATIP